jgi:site-specific DNA-methyltransferase (adenine-specific)
MTVAQISKDAKLPKKTISNYIYQSFEQIVNDDEPLNKKMIQGILSFVETQDDRIQKKLKGQVFCEEYGENRFLKLYHDDVISFLKKIPSNSVDVLVTDPAYSGMNKKLKLGKGRIVGDYKNKSKEDSKWFDEFDDTEENYSQFLGEAKRVLKKSTGHLYLMFDSFSLLTLGPIVRDHFDVKNLITWDKVNIGMGHYYRRRHEFIMFATNGNTRKIKNRQFPDVWRFKRIHASKYPTQKPVEVFQAMIHASAEPGFTICDPFLGSGASAIAAIKNDCNFIGCDISDRSLSLSSNRISGFLETGTDNLQKKSAAVDDKIFWE